MSASIVRMAACAYVIVGAAIVWLSLLLAPWGLLLLIVAFGAFGAAALCAFVAEGIAVLEEDES